MTQNLTCAHGVVSKSAAFVLTSVSRVCATLLYCFLCRAATGEGCRSEMCNHIIDAVFENLERAIGGAVSKYAAVFRDVSGAFGRGWCNCCCKGSSLNDLCNL